MRKVAALNQEEDKILMPRGDNVCQADSIQNNLTETVPASLPLHLFTIHFSTIALLGASSLTLGPTPYVYLGSTLC